jgi:hypothetical protein
MKLFGRIRGNHLEELAYSKIRAILAHCLHQKIRSNFLNKIVGKIVNETIIVLNGPRAVPRVVVPMTTAIIGLTAFGSLVTVAFIIFAMRADDGD